VAIDSADEENVEALKKWWQENGKQILISVFFCAWWSRRMGVLPEL
jgi:predicted negative regulator of RcsB-dependent stress response